MRHPERGHEDHGVCDLLELEIELLTATYHGFNASRTLCGRGKQRREPGIFSESSKMRHRDTSLTIPLSPSVVGSVHTLKGLELALSIPPADVDVIELRLDALCSHDAALERLIPLIRHPIVLTARNPTEGGLEPTFSSWPVRESLLRRFFRPEMFVDLELRCIIRSKPIQKFAHDVRARGGRIIGSYHRFLRTPSELLLSRIISRVPPATVDIWKVAGTASSAAEMSILCNILASFQARNQQAAVMGMGTLGKASRILLAGCGSVLNYGYLDCPNAPGQLEATALARQLREAGFRKV
jgi:3-dehydroquinate dehydratase-1